MRTVPSQQPALADHRHRVTDDWLEDGSVTTGKLDPGVYGPAPNTIEPDDAAAAGTADTLSRSDHEHAIVAAAAADLTLTGTSTEGSATSFARSDHVHATDALPWGPLANGRFTSTSSDSARAAGVDTDMTVTVSLATGRLYGALVHSQVDIGTANQPYALELEHDGTIIARVYRWGNGETSVDSDLFCNSMVPFTVASADASAVITVSNAAGSGGTITMIAGAGNPRSLTVFDMGPV